MPSIIHNHPSSPIILQESFHNASLLRLLRVLSLLHSPKYRIIPSRNNTSRIELLTLTCSTCLIILAPTLMLREISKSCSRGRRGRPSSRTRRRRISNRRSRIIAQWLINQRAIASRRSPPHSFEDSGSVLGESSNALRLVYFFAALEHSSTVLPHCGGGFVGSRGGG